MTLITSHSVVTVAVSSVWCFVLVDFIIETCNVVNMQKIYLTQAFYGCILKIIQYHVQTIMVIRILLPFTRFVLLLKLLIINATWICFEFSRVLEKSLKFQFSKKLLIYSIKWLIRKKVVRLSHHFPIYHFTINHKSWKLQWLLVLFFSNTCHDKYKYDKLVQIACFSFI